MSYDIKLTTPPVTPDARTVNPGQGVTYTSTGTPPFTVPSSAVDAPDTQSASRSTFAIGDVVRLKSGGPLMTVESTRRGPAVVSVCWADASGVLQHATLAVQMVEPGESALSSVAREAYETAADRHHRKQDDALRRMRDNDRTPGERNLHRMIGEVLPEAFTPPATTKKDSAPDLTRAELIAGWRLRTDALIDIAKTLGVPVQYPNSWTENIRGEILGAIAKLASQIFELAGGRMDAASEQTKRGYHVSATRSDQDIALRRARACSKIGDAIVEAGLTQEQTRELFEAMLQRVTTTPAGPTSVKQLYEHLDTGRPGR